MSLLMYTSFLNNHHVGCPVSKQYIQILKTATHGGVLLTNFSQYFLPVWSVGHLMTPYRRLIVLRRNPSNLNKQLLNLPTSHVNIIFGQNIKS